LTTSEVANLLRVSPDRVRQLIRSGELAALDMGSPSRPRFVVLPAHVREFARKRSPAVPPKPARRRRRPVGTDYYPDA
jgi:excisionase family DNA binding protein